MGNNSNTIIKIVSVVVTVIITFAVLVYTGPPGICQTAFVAGVGPEIEVFGPDQERTVIPRGTEVVNTNESSLRDGVRYVKIEVETTSDGESDTSVYYIDEKNLADDIDEAVREKEIYVRTPATIYENESGAEIAGFAPKGTKLKVESYDEILDNGAVNRYEVSCPDSKDVADGYIYGKYVVMTQEEADEYYNENGEYDKAKKSRYHIELYAGKGEDLDYYPCERPDIEGNEFCREARGMYLNWAAAMQADKYIGLIEETDCNAVVIDIKDGVLAYKSPVAKKLSPTSYKHAANSVEEYQEQVRKFDAAGLYTIGRITCFTDESYAKDNPEDCIKAGSTVIGWPSAFSRDAWYYNVSLAIEAVELMGFNEIQFDYVRFPERTYELSKAGNTDFRNKYGEDKAQAIQNFCFYAADQIHEAGAYFSVDVFGECSDGYVAAYGQYWPAISNVVDAISSMPYTDHYGRDVDTWSSPKGIMKMWAKNAAGSQKQIPTPAVARTWITGYNTPHWNPTVNYDTEKLKVQVDALYEAGLDGGFIPWHSGSSLEKYRQYKEIWNYKR